MRHVEDTWKQAGNVSLVAAARHRQSGELAAYSVLVAAGKPSLAEQDEHPRRPLATAGIAWACW